MTPLAGDAGHSANRLERLRASLRLAGLDAIVVTHLPNIRYLTGLNASAGLAVVTLDACALAVDFRYRTAAEAIQHEWGGLISLHVVEGTFEAWLIGYLQHAAVARTGVEANVMPVGQFNRLSAGLAAGAPFPLQRTGGCPVLVPTEQVVENLRVVKDEGELAVLREAGARLSRIAGQLASLARPGRTEQAVAADIEAGLRGEGFERPAFETIVASGPNGALPHARPGTRVLAEGEAVVLDFGGVYDGYCVDLTRTVRLGQQPQALARLFGAVAEAREAALAAVRPGALPSQVDAAARQVLERAGLGDAFGHATGHGLGLEVHEAPRIGRRLEGRDEVPVSAGMVFTIEPGAYVPGLGGVRIEDDVVVTASGYELLTRVPVVIDGVIDGVIDVEIDVPAPPGTNGA